MKSFKTYLKENSKSKVEIHTSRDYTTLMKIINSETIDKGLSYDDVIIDAKGTIDMSLKNISSIPVQFGKVNTDFLVRGNNLKYLENSPSEVGGDFDCDNNKLKTLDGCPTFVKGRFSCRNNNLNKIDYTPEKATAMSFADNNIKSLLGIHKLIKSVTFIDFSNNPIVEGGIGLIFIKDLDKISYDHNNNWNPNFTSALKIIKKYLGKGKPALLACANELDEIGLGDFAKL